MMLSLFVSQFMLEKKFDWSLFIYKNVRHFQIIQIKIIEDQSTDSGPINKNKENYPKFFILNIDSKNQMFVFFFNDQV